MTLRVRALSDEEAHTLARMTRSQKLGAGLVRRARIIQHAVDGLSAPGIAAKIATVSGRLTPRTVLLPILRRRYPVGK